MGPNVRRAFAILSACGIGMSIVVYVESFVGATIGINSGWITVLFVGAFVLTIPMLILEYPESRTPAFYWKGFSRGMPTWVVYCSWLFWATAIAQFVWFVLHAGAGSPTILDGQYVLDERGHILRVLTKEEYFSLEGAELRGVCTLIICVYFPGMTYWWFRRNNQTAE